MHRALLVALVLSAGTILLFEWIFLLNLTPWFDWTWIPKLDVFLGATSLVAVPTGITVVVIDRHLATGGRVSVGIISAAIACWIVAGLLSAVAMILFVFPLFYGLIGLVLAWYAAQRLPRRTLAWSGRALVLSMVVLGGFEGIDTRPDPPMPLLVEPSPLATERDRAELLGSVLHIEVGEGSKAVGPAAVSGWGDRIRVTFHRGTDPELRQRYIEKVAASPLVSSVVETTRDPHDP